MYLKHLQKASIFVIISLVTVNALIEPFKCNFSEEKEYKTKLVKFVRDPHDCRVFHICAFNKQYTHTCVDGFFFDNIINTCNHEYMVDCENTVSNSINAINSTYEIQYEKTYLNRNENNDWLNKDSSLDDLKENNYFEIILQDPYTESTNELFIEKVSNANEQEIINSYSLNEPKSSNLTTFVSEKDFNHIQPNFEPFEPLDLKPDEISISKQHSDKKSETASTKIYPNNVIESKESTSYLQKLKTIYDAFQTTTIPISTITTTEPLVETQPVYIENATSTIEWYLGPLDCVPGFSHRIPHEDNCGKYYECLPNGDKIEYACSYPMQFDVFYYECRAYNLVECRNRKPAKDLCDYKLSRTSLSAIPCYMYPSCKNLKDGIYPDIMRDCRQYFQCKDERTLATMSCPQNETYGGLKFNYHSQRCDIPMRVSYTCGGFSIPIDFYTGKMTCPIGSLIAFFSHPTECHIYLSCSNGIISTMECPEGLHFSAKHQKCVERSIANCNTKYSSEDAENEQI